MPDTPVPILRVSIPVVLTLTALGACVRPDDAPVAPRYVPVPIEALPGWADGRQAGALGALRRSCATLGRPGATAPAAAPPDAPSRTLADWRRACRNIAGVAPGDDLTARARISAVFAAFRLSDANRPGRGLFTGYFEPSLPASPVRTARYRYPIHGLPPTRPGPLPARAEIARDAAGKGASALGWPVLFWAADPVELFFLHIQGSGLLRLPDGRVARVGYAGNNGHPYRAIGRLMIERGYISRGDVSMQSIVAWLKANPGRQRAVFDYNPRYIFFRRLPASGPGPLGAAGLPLTPGRSLAVDPAYVAYGTPVWLDTRAPGAPDTPLRRLLVAQDTGSAIRGAVRGDIFFGSGPAARAAAGRMKAPGRWYILLPRPTRPRAAGR